MSDLGSRARAFGRAIRTAHGSLPSVLGDRARTRAWLLSARRAQVVCGGLIGFGLLVLPPVRDAALGALLPDEVRAGFFGLGRRVTENPNRAVAGTVLTSLYWLLAAGGSLALLWLELPAAASRALGSGSAGEAGARPGACGAEGGGTRAARARRELENAHTVVGLPGAATAAPARYAVEAELGRGGMGVVLRARDTRLGRQVALKQLFPELMANPDWAARFHREAQVLAQLTHAHIVQIYDLVTEGPGAWMAMELVQGGSLAARLRAEGPLPFGELRRLGMQMAEALAHAHAHGVIHRNFKPDNVMLTAEGSVKVADFGIAAVAGQLAGAKLTAAGAALGSPGYMSPEQISAAPVDPRSDVYALGITLYEMATGRTPFEGDTASVLAQHLTALPPLPPPGAAELPRPFVALLEAMLHKRPEQRPESMREVCEALRAM